MDSNGLLEYLDGLLPTLGRLLPGPLGLCIASQERYFFVLRTNPQLSAAYQIDNYDHGGTGKVHPVLLKFDRVLRYFACITLVWSMHCDY